MTDHEEALIDRPDAVDTTCPHCHRETGLPRGAGPVLPGGLRLDEFRVLVRNEWRRRLGPDAYGRNHVGRIAGTLADLAADPESARVRGRLREEVWEAVARVLATGAGRDEVRRELAKLVQAIRAVLLDAGVDSRTVRDTYVRTAREALDDILNYPPPSTIPTRSGGER